MRSFGFTLILALLATLVGGAAFWLRTGGSLDSILGVPPTPVGQPLYTAFTPDKVKYITVSQKNVRAAFSLTPNGWQSNSPWKDRMDARAAVGIINFTLGMRVEDLSPVDEIDAQKAGLRESGIDIWLENDIHQVLARYKIGRRTPWLAEVKDIEKPVPTVFVWTRDTNRKGYIYTCTGDITPLFKDNLKFLRDHRPFYFNPINLQKIRIRAVQGELTLGRETPTSPWRVVKPLDLHTDPKAIKSLIEGIYELQAVKVSDRASVTVPASGTAVQSTQIAITSFGSEVETVLNVSPPETAGTGDAKATVSDRPDTIFDLPLKPEPNLVSLADIPLAVNDLRDPSLTNLNIQSLRGLSIQPATGTEIVISRTTSQPWMATIDGQTHEANEERLYTLLKAVTEGRAIGYESDAATDFTPWGLDRPFLKLRFLGQDNQVLELAFGIDGKGGYFVNRSGTPTVVRVDESLVASIAVRPYEWRHARLWSVDRQNLITIVRTSGAESPVFMNYNNKADTWEGKRNERGIEIDPEHANYVLGILEGLKVSRWLSPSDQAANAALAAPFLTFTVMERTTDEMDGFKGFITRTVRFAPNTPGSNPGFYYGRLDSDPNPFLLDRDTFGKIATDVLDKK
ncbi:MAG: DUF4340 domain-containing protein [Luteolibacter sp.]